MKFWALKFVARLHVLMGVLLIGAGIWLLFDFHEYLRLVGYTEPSAAAYLGVVVVLIFAGLFAIAQGQVFQVLIAIEENTRKVLQNA